MDTRVSPFVQFAASAKPFAAKPKPVFQGVLAQPAAHHGGKPTSALPTTAQYLSFLGNVRFAGKTAADKLPPAPRDASVVDDFHGTPVTDPYRPLEDLDAKATTDWWHAQTERTKAFIAGAQAEHDATVTWHEQIRDFTREGVEVNNVIENLSGERHGKNYFFLRQSGLDPQPTLYVRIGRKNAKPKVLLDPNTLSADGTVAVNTTRVSPDGKLLAYALNDGGSDLSTLYIRNVETGEDLPDKLTNMRMGGNPVWDPDGKGFTYAQQIQPSGKPDPQGNRRASYHHTLGQPQSADVKVAEPHMAPNGWVSCARLDEDDAVYLMAGEGTRRQYGLSVKLPGETAFKEIFPINAALFSPVYRNGNTLYAVTDQDATRGRLVAVDINNPDPANWKTVIPESDDPGRKLDDAFVADGKLITRWSYEGADEMDVRTLDGEHLYDVPIPLGSSVGMTNVNPKDKEFEISVSGFLSPGTRYKYNVAKNELTFVKKSDIAHDLTEIADVERLYATSKDGTQVPMWVIKPKGLKMDGTAATQLYGYGGFNVPVSPGFSYAIMHWVEQGGVFVMSNLRGGNERGSDWHKQGALRNKQNVFDDFAACAQKLIKDKYTQPSRLAIYGGSNGGLLTAATSQQYPDLFGAVISAVPVIDMLRYLNTPAGGAWRSDYGDPVVSKEDFEASIAYSPLHNVADAKDVTYPPTLITTGDHDDRVAPWHAFKWAATRQEKGHQDNTYLRVEERAGHGHGKPTAKIIEESADKQAFLVQTLGPVNQDEYKAQQAAKK